MISLNVNGKLVQADADGDTPLLWVLRDHLDMTGTQVRLRHGAVRRLHRARRRQADAQLRARRCPPSPARRSRRSRRSATPRVGKAVQARGSQRTFRSAATASPAR